LPFETFSILLYPKVCYSLDATSGFSSLAAGLWLFVSGSASGKMQAASSKLKPLNPEPAT